MGGYMLFDRAESLHMTVGKLLTGRDMPLMRIEMELNNTYRQAKGYLERQQRQS